MPNEKEINSNVEEINDDFDFEDDFSETEGEVARQIPIPGLTGIGSFGRVDTATGDIGVEVPDLDLSGFKFEDTDDGDGETSFTESLKNTWNNSLNQLSLTDDRFYWLSEYLFGDTDSANFQDAEQAIEDTEETSGETIGFTDVDDIYAEEGVIGAIGGITAATVNAASSFATSAVQSITTGGAALAVDMVQGSVRDYNVEKAKAEGVSLEELIKNGDAETLIPGALGAISYRFEKAGLKGVGKAIKAMPNGAKKALVQIANAAGKEGGTEFAQGIVESFSSGLGRSGKDVGKAAADVGEWIQEEGLETFLQGAVGGGVSAGGGSILNKKRRSIRDKARLKVASQIRSKEAEEAIMRDSKEIMELDRKLNNPKIPKEQKDILQRTRKDLVKNFKEAVKEPFKAVQHLNDKEVDDINKKGDKIKELRKELKETEILGEDVTDIVKNNINKRVEKEINGINKILENRSDKPVRTEGGAISANPAVEAIFEGKEKGEITESEAATVAYEYEGLAVNEAEKLWRKDNAYEDSGFDFNQFVGDLTFGIPGAESNSLVGLAKSFDPKKGSFSGYAQTWLKERGKAVLDKRIGREVDTEKIKEGETGGTVEQPGVVLGPKHPSTTRALSQRLGFTPETATKIQDKVRDALGSTKLTTATVDGFNKSLKGAAKEQLYDVVRTELGKGNKFFSNLTKNAPQYFKMIPIESLTTASNALTKGDQEVKARIDNWKAIKQKGGKLSPQQEVEFINHFRAKDTTAQNRSNRKENLANWIAQGLFNEAADAILTQSPEIGRRLELAQEFKDTDKVGGLEGITRILRDKTVVNESRVKGLTKGEIRKSNKSAVQNLTDVMSQAWNKNKSVPVFATTDAAIAVTTLLDNKNFDSEAKAREYLNEIEGFTMLDNKGQRFIYNAKDASLDTPVHEFGHVWSGFIQDNNPKLWNEGVKVLLKDHVKRDFQLDRLKGNYSNQKEWTSIINKLSKEGITDAEIDQIVDSAGLSTKNALDEMLAGEIGDKGRERVIMAQYGEAHTEYNFSEILNNIWDYIGKLLANVKGKKIKDLTANEFLDLAVNDVLKGTPGASFAQMSIPVGTYQFQKIKNEAINKLPKDKKEDYYKYMAMQAISKDPTASGIAKAYSHVSDFMSDAEFDTYVESSVNQHILDTAQLQKGLLAGDAIDKNTEYLWRDAAGGKLNLLIGRPGKSWQNDEAKIQEKFDKNRDFFTGEYKDLFVEHLPSEFFLSLAGKKKDGSNKKEAILLTEDAELLASEAKPSGLVWTNPDAFSRIANADTPAKLNKIANDPAYQAEVTNNQDVIFAFGDAVQAMSKAGVPSQVLGSLVKSFTNTGNGRTNIFRKGPRLNGYSGNISEVGKGNFVPEHNPPAGYIALDMFSRALRGQFNDDAKQAIRDKFHYYALDKADDPGTGIGSTNLRSGISKGFDITRDNPLVRYVISGGNIANLKDLDGNFIAEGLGIKKQYLLEAQKEVKENRSLETVRKARGVKDLTTTIATKAGAKRDIQQVTGSRSYASQKRGTTGYASAPGKLSANPRGFDNAVEAWKKGFNSFKHLISDSDQAFLKDKFQLKGKSVSFFDALAAKQDVKDSDGDTWTHKDLGSAIQGIGEDALSNAKKSGIQENKKRKDINRAVAEELGANFDKRDLQDSRVDAEESKLHAFDFDDTLFSTNSKTTVIRPDGSTYKLTAEQFAIHRKGEGESYDFTDFDKVIDPVGLKSLKLLDDAILKGDDVVILTARTMKAKDPVLELMKDRYGGKAANIKFKGVAHSSPDAKVNYLVNSINKHGYNNVFFTDDAISNVDAVKKALGKIKNVKSEVQLAQAIGVEQAVSDKFNEILEQKTGVKAGKEFDSVDIANANKKFKLGKFWLPPSAEDLKGMIYSMIPGGKEGNKALEFFDEMLFKPYSKAVAKFQTEKLTALDDLKRIIKAVKLTDTIPNSTLTVDQAIRLYLWNDIGTDTTGVSQSHIDDAVNYVAGHPELKGLISKLQRTTNYKYDKFEADSWYAGTLQSDLHGYFNDSRRKELLGAWKENKDQIFSKKNLDKLKVTHGENFVKALENTFERQWSGKNRNVSADSSTNRVLDWINNASSTIMFLNMRSAALQALSTINYIFEPGTIGGFKSKNFGKNVAQLWNSDYLRSRRGESGFDISATEVADVAASKNGMKKLVARLIQAGFAPTKAVDSAAIAFFGAAYYQGQLNKGATHEEALRRWQETSEEQQQSARPDRVSQIQSGPLGRIIFAFGNTPFQYARLTKRAIQDVTSGRSKARGTVGSDVAKLAWYGAVQSLIFTQLQNAVNWLDGDEEEDQKNEWAINSFITSYLKAFGGPGAIASAGYSILADLDKLRKGEYVPGGVTNAATSISPPIASRLRKLNKLGKEVKKNPDDFYDPRTEAFWKTLGYGLNVGANIPLDRAIEKFNNLEAVVQEDYSMMDNIALIMGWKEWQLGLTGSRSGDEWSGSDFSDDDFDFDDDEFSDSAFNRGETGQAFNDGTIEVDPNLSPIEREKTIAHEEEHVRQMAEDGLDYDEEFVYYKGGQHRRKNGNIRYNGKWMKEGDKKLPWEAHAYEAESPIARTDKDKKKEDEKYIRNPEHIEQVNKSRDRFEQHYSDPVTEELYRQNTGFNDLPSKVDNALNTRIQTGFVPQGAKATYDPAIGDYKGEITVEDYRDPAVVDHELTHAAGFDEALGKEAQKILGKPKSGDKYLSKPSEVYGNLHEFRARLDLKGFERNLSPKKVQDLIKFNELEDDPDIKQMIDEFGLDKLSEALNKIASNKDKPTLEGLYG